MSVSAPRKESNTERSAPRLDCRQPCILFDMRSLEHHNGMAPFRHGEHVGLATRYTTQPFVTAGGCAVRGCGFDDMVRVL